MKKFIVDVHYGGSIVVKVEAENEDEACELAQRTVESMNDEDFFYRLERQYPENNVIEVTDV